MVSAVDPVPIGAFDVLLGLHAVVELREGVAGGVLFAGGIPEHEPTGQDIRAVRYLTAKAEGASRDRADSEAADLVNDSRGNGAICGAYLHSAGAGRHDLSENGLIGHLYLQSEVLGCERQVP
jgi:hypothetical protein